MDFNFFEKIKFKQPFRFIDIAVQIGIGGVAVIVVAYWILWGSPTKVEVEQSGFRGTGMAQLEFESELRRLASVNVMPESEEPWIPEGGEPLARDIYENVQVLGNLTEDNFNRLMLAITEWVSPELGCVYCHGDLALEDYGQDNLYTKIVARSMLQMTININSQWTDHVAETGVNCYTCHRGQNVPEYLWFEPEPVTTLGPNSAYQNRPIPIAGYSSMSARAIQDYLVGDEEIRQLPTMPNQKNDTFGTIQSTYKNYSLMIHMSESLGVNCTFCHNTRAMSQWDQSPPQRVTAWHGIRMVREINNVYLDPLQPVYPPERLGPLGDAPKAMCTTCHQGVNKPLYGAPAVANWPELVSTDPVYPEEAAMAD